MLGQGLDLGLHAGRLADHLYHPLEPDPPPRAQVGHRVGWSASLQLGQSALNPVEDARNVGVVPLA